MKFRSNFHKKELLFENFLKCFSSGVVKETASSFEEQLDYVQVFESTLGIVTSSAPRFFIELRLHSLVGIIYRSFRFERDVYTQFRFKFLPNETSCKTDFALVIFLKKILRSWPHLMTCVFDKIEVHVIQ